MDWQSSAGPKRPRAMHGQSACAQATDPAPVEHRFVSGADAVRPVPTAPFRRQHASYAVRKVTEARAAPPATCRRLHAEAARHWPAGTAGRSRRCNEASSPCARRSCAVAARGAYGRPGQEESCRVALPGTFAMRIWRPVHTKRPARKGRKQRPARRGAGRSAGWQQNTVGGGPASSAVCGRGRYQPRRLTRMQGYPADVRRGAHAASAAGVRHPARAWLVDAH